MHILVTGGAGFIGSNIADRLISDGHSVVIVDNLFSGYMENVNPAADFRNVDVTDFNALEEVFKEKRFDAVFHLAAQIDVRKSGKDPAFDASVNIIGGINLLKLMEKYKSGKLIYSSTGGAIYGEPKSIIADENQPAEPIAPYGVSKFCLERYIEYFHRMCGIEYTIFRYANVYGPRQDPLGEAGVIAIFMGKMIKGEGTVIFGNGKQTRDFVFIDDIVSANIAALSQGSGEIINIGTGIEVSVNEIHSCLTEIFEIKEPAEIKPERKGEVFRIALDASKAKKILGWSPKFTLKEGLKITADYMRRQES